MGCMIQDNTTPHRAEEYDEKILQTLPFYPEFHSQTIELIRQKQNVSDLLDIGCGTGVLETLILREFPDIKITAIDPSVSMLEEAQKRNQTDQITYRCQSSESIEDENAFDVITAIQVHHYLQQAGREQATANIFRALRQGGYYISFENVIPEEEELLSSELERWKRYQISRGKSVDEAEAHIKRCGVNYFPISVRQHIALLRKTGFRMSYVFWKSYMQMGILGIK